MAHALYQLQESHFAGASAPFGCRELQTDEELEWIETGNPEVLHFSRSGGWQSVTNFGPTGVELPAGAVLASSAPLEDGKLPANSTVWLR